MTGDPRVVRGMARQLGTWRAELASGAGRAGWKIGLNARAVQERLGLTESVVGHLTDVRVLRYGYSHSLAGTTRPVVEAEVAATILGPVAPDAGDAAVRAAIVALAPALEVVDLDRPLEDIEEVVATNVFHCGVMFGRDQAARAGGALEGIRVTVDHGGTVTGPFDAAGLLGDLVPVVRLVARTLAAFGEGLVTGDRIITGALAAIPVAPGDSVDVDFGPLGELGLRFDD